MRLVLALACLFLPGGIAWGAEVDLEALQDRAVSANPDLVARQARVREIRSRAEVAGTWMDPMLAVEYSNAPVSTFSITDHPMAGLQFKVQQQLRPLGWSGKRRDVMDQMATSAEHELDEAELGLRAGVARAYWSLARTRALRRVTEAHVQRTTELHLAVVARYEVGSAGQHAVLRLGVLRDRLTDELNEFDREEREWLALLAQALGGETHLEVSTPERVDPVPPPDSVDGWLTQAEASRPAVLAMRAMADSERAGAALARAEALPDPSIWAGYRVRLATTDVDPGVDFVSVGLGVPLPVGSGRKAQGERGARLEAASRVDAQTDAMLDSIAAQAERILARWERAHGKAKTYADVLLPGSTSALEAADSEFAVGRTGFASLFEAEVALLDLERKWIAAAVATRIAEADARALVGGSVGETP